MNGLTWILLALLWSSVVVYTPVLSTNQGAKPIALKEHELRALQQQYSFVILVYAWKRRASLKRLCNSLTNVNYHQFDVRLEFHVEGDAHPLVMQYINGFQWPHGPKLVHRRQQRVGLEKAIMASWPADNDRELAFLFEDDIEVSPWYFEYVLLLLHTYQPVRNAWNIGIALTTPRFNEVNIPHRTFLPDTLIRRHPDDVQRTSTVYAHQLPCSWGALYFPWEWRAFQQYWAWRRSADAPGEELATVPYGYVNNWRRSWKRFMVEYTLIYGKGMLYPNLPYQQSYATHHREPGEHTRAAGERPIVDDLTPVKNQLLTVPLAMNQMILHLLRAHLPPTLAAVPVVNFYHKLMPGWAGLRQTGLPVREIMRRWLLNSRRKSKKQTNKKTEEQGTEFMQTSPCILDYLADDSLVPSKMAGRRRFLTFEPQGDFIEQTEQLRAAHQLARILDRELLVPFFQVPQPSADQQENGRVPLILDVKDLYVNWTSNATLLNPGHGNEQRPLGSRRVRIQTLDERGYQYTLEKDPALRSVVVMPVRAAHPDDLRRWFAACPDSVLTIDNAHLLHTNVQNSLENAMELRPEWRNMLLDVVKDFYIADTDRGVGRRNETAMMMACVNAPQLTDSHECWRLKRKSDMQAMYSAHCTPDIGLFKLMKETDYTAIYVIDSVERPIWNIKDVDKNLRPLLKRPWLIEEMRRRRRQQSKNEGDMPEPVWDQLARVWEVHMCTEYASDIVGSAYSWATYQMARLRDLQLQKNSAVPKGAHRRNRVRRLDGKVY